MIALTTRSTGMMSITPSGIAGKSGRAFRPYASTTGSAMRNPSIHPGYGRTNADSTIDGRTIDSGLSPARSSSAISVSAFVNP
jgi:hypothetical protein